MFFSFLFYYLFSSSRQYPSTTSYYASHNEFSPVSCSFSSLIEESSFNNSNQTSLAIFWRTYSKLAPIISSIDDPPTPYNETTNIDTMKKYIRYYQLLQLLQSPYLSQQKKIETLYQEDFLSTTPSPPKIWNGLDW
jgi:hypothetical protein